MARLHPARLLLGLLSALGLAVAPGAARGAEYRLGVVPQFEQRKIFDTWRPIADELERRTGHRIRLVSTLTISEFEQEFLRGGFDFVYGNPFLVATTHRTLGYLPLVRDRPLVRGILIVDKTGPLRKPGHLQGRRVALPARNAVASVLIRAELQGRLGVRIEPVYVKTVSNVVLHVAKGLADAGGLADKAFTVEDAALRERLLVIHTTPGAPSHPISAHPRVPRQDREQVRRALLDLAATEAGRALFAKIPMEEPVAATLEEYVALERSGLGRWIEPDAKGP